jgi:alpha-tubulin suppressor-like RCC1 family protein
VGAAHTCALVNGGVLCWGSNITGQLGNDTVNDSSLPVAVQGLGAGSGVQALVAGKDHTCALVNGGVQCWGDNSLGQLGNPNPRGLTPVTVAGLSGVQALASGDFHTCALVNGGVQCWGDNQYGQLGDSSTSSRSSPVAVQGLGSGVQAIAAGENHSCALVNGGVLCWGENNLGQLGDTSDGGTEVPIAVQNLGPGSGVQGVCGGGFHTCALVNGGVQCWGDNASGDLGDNSLAERSAPVPVQGLGGGVQALGLGQYHSCALVNGGVWCWGYNIVGQLGDGSDAGNSLVPVPVWGLGAGVQALAPSYDHTCALVYGGIQCWGENSHGELGNGTTIQSNVPVQVQGINGGVQAVAGGFAHACAVLNGGVQCWGDNENGDLGNNSEKQSNGPVAVLGLGGSDGGVQAIVAGHDHTCALVNGGVQCWGDGTSGQLGNNLQNDFTTPVAVQGLSGGVQAVAAGYSHTCALVGGGVRCWGNNVYGQLGDKSTVDSLVPIAVQGLGNPDSGVEAIATGDYHTCALVNGGLQCWGDNSDGDLGNNSLAPTNVPVAVQGLSSRVQAVSAGGYHTCALLNGGALCWGKNAFGELGDNSTADSYVPMPVQTLGSPDSGVQALAAGEYHTCALVNGGVWCWGENTNGQLGNGSDAGSSLVPVPVQGLGSGVQAVTAGAFYTCALVSGGVQCWGYNSSFQLGNTVSGQSNVPVAVSPWAQ